MKIGHAEASKDRGIIMKRYFIMQGIVVHVDEFRNY
jgi:hypothetical protein